MTHQFLPRAALVELVDTQQERIRVLNRKLDEKAAHNRRLQEQVVTLMGKLQQAKYQPLQEQG